MVLGVYRVFGVLGVLDLTHHGRLGHVKRRFYVFAGHTRGLVLEDPQNLSISSMFQPLPVPR